MESSLIILEISMKKTNFKQKSLLQMINHQTFSKNLAGETVNSILKLKMITFSSKLALKLW